MANEEHLALLRRGVKFWNKWREENSEIIPDLSNSNFINACLININLSKVQLVNSNFSHANLTWANLNGADLSKANLSHTALNNSQLIGAMFVEATLTGIEFVASILNNADFSYSNLADAEFYHADAKDAVFIKSDLTDADLTKADLTGANLSHAKLIRTRVLEANFTKANFTGACLEDWHRNSATILDTIFCKYIYLQCSLQERLPNDREFDDNEFSNVFQANRSYSRLAILNQKIQCFEKLLDNNPEGKESTFHEFLKENPELLDIYGNVESKPWFAYPPGKLSPTGKTGLEPDFIIRYPGNRYKLVEIEKPGKQIETRQGHPTSLFNQASWQLGERKTYLDRYSYLLEEKYPGISISEHRFYVLVIGRRIEPGYMGLLSNSNVGVEIFTYDDLLSKAKQAFDNLKALSL